MITYEDILKLTLLWEGGEVNDPYDPGGRTKYGISAAAHPDAWEDGPPSFEAAQEIYRRDYWERGPQEMYLDGLERSAGVFFDWTVTSGGARVQLQKLVGAEPDGLIGPKTLEAVLAYADTLLAQELLLRREAYYKKLARRRPTLNRFLNGWLNRCRSWARWVEK